jgi:hypothetical protein
MTRYDPAQRTICKELCNRIDSSRVHAIERMFEWQISRRDVRRVLQSAAVKSSRIIPTTLSFPADWFSVGAARGHYTLWRQIM